MKLVAMDLRVLEPAALCITSCVEEREDGVEYRCRINLEPIRSLSSTSGSVGGCDRDIEQWWG